MKETLSVRRLIYDQFHASTIRKRHFLVPKNADAYAAYDTAMYLIQDTGEAVSAHMVTDFSPEPMRAYLEFWGVMQAILIQQDAICELYKAVTGTKPEVKQLTAWQAIRKKRNLCAGHPANHSHSVPAPQRSFMGRGFGTYRSISYELWDAKTGRTTHPMFDLRGLIDGYDGEASQILRDLLNSMKSHWP